MLEKQKEKKLGCGLGKLTITTMNCLIFRYLQESGFVHSALHFGNEVGINESTIGEDVVPPGALVTFVQKGIQCLEVEANLSYDELLFLHPFDLITKDVDELQRTVKEKKENIQKDKSEGKEKVNTKSDCRLMVKDNELAPEKGSNKQQKGKDKEGDMERMEKEKEGDTELMEEDAMHNLPSFPSEFPNSDITVLQGHTSEITASTWNPTRSLLASGVLESDTGNLNEEQLVQEEEEHAKKSLELAAELMDSNEFINRIMTKMGYKEGLGLGSQLQGVNCSPFMVISDNTKQRGLGYVEVDGEMLPPSLYGE